MASHTMLLRCPLDARHYFVESVAKTVVAQIDAAHLLADVCPDKGGQHRLYWESRICGEIMQCLPGCNEIYQNFANVMEAGFLYWPIAKMIMFFKQYLMPEVLIWGVLMDRIVEWAVAVLDGIWSCSRRGGRHGL